MRRPPVDANVSDIVVVLDRAYEDKLAEAVDKLKSCGMDVRNADDDNSVVDGEIETCRIHDLEKLDCVDYVRRVFSYDANYPPGDPRDRDGV
jgi:hypothetical protein